MKSIKYILVVFLLLGFASCSNDDETDGLQSPDPEANNAEVNFNISFSDQLKVSTDAAFKSKFEAGDEIGLFAVKAGNNMQASGNYADNRKLTYNGTNWVLDGDAIFYPVDGMALSFYAYYPYTTTIDPTNTVFEGNSDQSQDAAYSKSDLLLSKTENQKDKTVNIQFSHAQSLIQVEVVKDDNLVPFDNTFTVKLLNIYPSSQVDLVAGTSSVKNTSIQEITMKRVETDASAKTYTYRALIPAQTIAGSTEIFSFVQTTTGKTINFKYITETATTLTAGKVTKWKITLKGEDVPPHVYAVGDVYPFNGTPAGIVFEVSNGGVNGKVVSLIEKQNRWGDNNIQESLNGVPAITDADNGKEATRALIEKRKDGGNFASDYAIFSWIYTTVNEGDLDGIWYLPAKNELKSLYAAMNGYTYSDIETSWIDGGVMPHSQEQASIDTRTAFNNKVTTAGGTAFTENGQYWATTEISKTVAWSVKIDTGILQNNKAKTDTYGRARLIRTF